MLGDIGVLYEQRRDDMYKSIDYAVAFNELTNAMSGFWRNEGKFDPYKFRNRFGYIPNPDINATCVVIANTIKRISGERGYKVFPIRVKFLEIGCGIGLYAFLIGHLCGAESSGIDIDPKIIKRGKIIFGKHHEIFKMNMWTHPTILNDKDVAYYYSPTRGESSGEFFKFVVNNMRNNSYLVCRFHSEYETNAFEQYISEGKVEKIAKLTTNSLCHVFKVIK